MINNDEIWKKMSTPIDVSFNCEDSFLRVKGMFERHVGDGTCVRCPMSGTIHNMPYRRTISKGMARALKLLYRIQVDKINDGTAPNQFADFTKLRYWGLIQQDGESTRWNITSQGVSFVEGSSTVAKNAIVVNNLCTQFMGEHVSIADILSK